jgi:biopolymer transport protein TolR
MAGAAPVSMGRGGRRSLDASINLVPFIDLLSCCISFLLITAVWVQLARIDVKQKTAGRGEEPAVSQVRLVLNVNRDGYLLQKSTGETREIALLGQDYDYARLSLLMQDLKREHGDVSDITVRVVDGVLYQRIIRTIDQVLSVGGDRSRPLFPDVSVTAQEQGG